MMRTGMKAFIAASVIGATSIAAVQPAEARDHGGAAIAAGIIGLGVGAAIASSVDRGYYGNGYNGYYDAGYPAYYGGGYGYYGPSYYGPAYGVVYAPGYYGRGYYGGGYGRGYYGRGGGHYGRGRGGYGRR